MAVVRIAIVGAGPAGLVAAIAARRLGLEVEVFEQAEHFGRVGGGILIHSNGLRTLDALGVLEAFEARARTTQTIRMEDGDGRELSKFDYRKLDVPLNRCAVVLRATLLEVLLDAAGRAGVSVRFGHRCTGAVVDASGVTLGFEGRAEARAEVALACDGINSRLRDAIGLASGRRAIGEAYLRGTAPMILESDAIRELWGSRGRRFGICPLDERTVYFYCNAPLGRWTETLERDLDGFVASWSDFHPDAVALLLAVPDWSRVNYSELHEIVLDRWWRERVFLVGDAAHAMTPNLGQGANSAMVDALVLVRLLARERLDAVGPAYEAVRKRFVTKIQDAARQMGQLAAWSGFFSRLLRGRLISAAGRVDALSRPGMLLGAGYNPAERAFFERL